MREEERRGEERRAMSMWREGVGWGGQGQRGREQRSEDHGIKWKPDFFIADLKCATFKSIAH